MESGLHRHTDSYEYGELLQPAARGDSSYRHLRRVQRYRAPLHTNPRRQHRASRRLAPSCGIAAAYTAIVGLFPSLTLEQRMTLHDKYVASLAALSDDGGDGGQSRDRGITWGEQVATMVLAWRATDGFVRNPPYGPFIGGLAVGQWRPTGGSCAAMSALGLAFTAPFVWSARSSSIPDHREVWPTMPTISTASRRSVDRRDRRAPTSRLCSRRSGRETPACTGNQAANQIARAT